MPVTIKDVEHIAELANLEFSENEKVKLTQQMNRILEYVEHMDKLDTEKVEPLSHVIELNNVFRADEARPGISAEEALKNAPSKDEHFFKVPKVIGEK
jgi:aspartyl-tRNA(Asn)/glutamyl-tRNA(Gln) amidotransferase subunit C